MPNLIPNPTPPLSPAGTLSGAAATPAGSSISGWFHAISPPYSRRPIRPVKAKVLSVFITLAALLLVVALPLAGQTTAPAFKDGDRIAFIGDSITHYGSYHTYVYEYYLTRFPKQRFAMFNCGVSAETAGMAIDRFESDIMSRKPTVATIMLGMNDVGRGMYSVNAPGAEVLAKRKNALNEYRTKMAQLEGLLRERSVRVILLTPSPYDQTMTGGAPNYFGVNDALATCSKYLREQASRQDFGFIDFHGPYTALNLLYQKPNPALTLVSMDRVHPMEIGHIILSYLFLKAQGMKAQVATVALDARQKSILTQENCVIDQADFKTGQISFRYTAQALPMPASHYFMEADKIVPYVADLSQELFKVQGLEAGDYVIEMDGMPVGNYAASALAEGVNLAANPNTPMQKQAMKVHDLNYKRMLAEKSLRDIVKMELGAKVAGRDPSKEGELAAYFEDLNGPLKNDYKHVVYRSHMANAQKALPREAEFRQTVEQSFAALYAANQPVAHNVVIRAINKR